MNPTFENVFFDIEIIWTKPVPYNEVFLAPSKYNEEANLYMITARFSDNDPKILYIGKTWRQGVHKRIGQPDHKRRIAQYRELYSHHKFEIRHGILKMNGCNLTEKRLKDIENLLIYISDNHNIKSVVTHGVVKSYKILNSGHRGSLPKNLAFGLFSSAI